MAKRIVLTRIGQESTFKIIKLGATVIFEGYSRNVKLLADEHIQGKLYILRTVHERVNVQRMHQIHACIYGSVILATRE